MPTTQFDDMKYLTTILLLFPLLAQTQTPDTLTADLPFFEKQAVEYQQWLVKNGLNAVLRVQYVEVRSDTQFILYLGFYTSSADSARALWDGLRAEYRQLNTGDSLEKALFDRMVFAMAVPPKQAEIRVFETYNLNIKAEFGRRLFFRNGKFETVSKAQKSEDRKIKITPVRLQSNGKPMSTDAFQKKCSRDRVFAILKKYFTGKYSNVKCENRQPNIKFFNEEDELHFEVRNLCKEVLKDEENPWWCKVLYQVNYTNEKHCIKRERLMVHITYESTDKGRSFILRTKIDASYGSGWYDNPRDNGYHDLQLDFPDYLATYADELNQEISKILICD